MLLTDIQPINTTVKAKSHSPQYKMHKYFARRPYNVFSHLISHYTEEDDIILDCFVGGGVTVFESLALKRKVIGVDLNPLATFITEMQIKKYDLKQLKLFIDHFYKRIENELSHFYEIIVDNQVCKLEWTEWACVVECPHCLSPIPLTDDHKIRNGIYRCPKRDCQSNTLKVIGLKRTDCFPLPNIPIRIRFQNSEGSLHVKTLSEAERLQFSMIDYKTNLKSSSINIDEEIPKEWDRQLEDCLTQKGIQRFSDLFTERNFVVNTLIFNHIMDMRRDGHNKDMVDCLYFIFSASLRYTNNMTRVTENWENGKPTSMDKHAYWLPNIFVETNVLDKFKNRMESITKGLTYTDQAILHDVERANSFDELNSGKSYMILNQSSSQLPIPNESVSAVITDPPYGSNVQYAELSAFWNVWYQKYTKLDSFIFNEEEAIVNRKQSFSNSKTVDHYEDMLFNIFTECYRVLKNDGYLVFTFNNKDINVWVALLKAVARAGFYLPENGVIFQDFIESYKNTAHLKYSGNIHGDFIYSFKKGASELMPTYDSKKEYIEIIGDEIENCIKDMYLKHHAFSTTELYQSIFSKLVPVILHFAIHGNSDKQLTQFEIVSSNFVDDSMKKLLIHKNDLWVKREDVQPSDTNNSIT